jgi:hypothetical protein
VNSKLWYVFVADTRHAPINARSHVGEHFVVRCSDDSAPPEEIRVFVRENRPGPLPAYRSVKEPCLITDDDLVNPLPKGIIKGAMELIELDSDPRKIGFRLTRHPVAVLLKNLSNFDRLAGAAWPPPAQPNPPSPTTSSIAAQTFARELGMNATVENAIASQQRAVLFQGKIKIWLFKADSMMRWR